jgi:hypothetical protein
MLPGTATQTPKHNIQRKPALRNDFAVAVPGAKRPLGNTADFASRARKTRKRRHAFELQKTARAILPGDHRIQKCYRYSAYGTTYSTIESNGERSRLSGVHTCDCGYACPVCAPKIAMKHANELAAATTAAYAKGWRVLHVTYTLSHHRGESLEAVLSSISDARRKYFLAGRGYQAIKRAAGIEGSARALETTYGENGWHPHYHELLFVSGLVADDFEQVLKTRWLEAVQKVGGYADDLHGLKVEEGSRHISEYLNKMGHLPAEGGHSIEMELSHGYAKNARKEGKTPFALLAAAAEGDELAGKLFGEYALAMAGRALIRWSKGLRQDLGLSDEENREQSEGDNLFVEVAALEWAALKVISDHCIMPAVLLAATAGYDVLKMFLADYDLIEDYDYPRLFVKKRSIRPVYSQGG